jgi:hypothetical protein
MLFFRNLGGFLVYNFMKFWDGVRLSPINNVCVYIYIYIYILYLYSTHYTVGN